MKGFKWWKPKSEREQKNTETECQEKTSLIDGEEMSKLDPILPRYYEGYDIDVLISKMNDGRQLTEEESLAYIHASDIYYEKEFARRTKRWEEQLKAAKKSGNPFALDRRTDPPCFDVFDNSDGKDSSDENKNRDA